MNSIFIKWDYDGRGFIIPLKLCEKYSAYMCFRVVDEYINVCLKIYPKRSKINGYNGKIVFECSLDSNKFDAFIKALQKIGLLLPDNVKPSLEYELDKVILHLCWLKNYFGGGVNG